MNKKPKLNNVMTYEKWKETKDYVDIARTIVFFAELIVAIVFFLAVDDSSVRTVKTLNTIVIVLTILLLISVVFWVYLSTMGKEYFHRYATMMIDYNDEIDVVGIMLDDEDLYLEVRDKDDSHRIDTESINFRTYEIEVEIRDDVEKPLFSLEDGLITSLAIPYIKGGEYEFDAYEIERA